VPSPRCLRIAFHAVGSVDFEKGFVDFVVLRLNCGRGMMIVISNNASLVNGGNDPGRTRGLLVPDVAVLHLRSHGENGARWF
jgi:hypothetical protein